MDLLKPLLFKSILIDHFYSIKENLIYAVLHYLQVQMDFKKVNI